jgi:taurine dioxygenase
MIEIRRLGKQIGAEITGINVNSLDDGTFAQVYRAWLDCNVVVVRDQKLEIDEFLTYSRRFGTLHAHPLKMANHAQHPELTVLGVNKFDADGKLNLKVYQRGSKAFHTDGAYDQVPFKATQLHAIALPSRGGDTYFASMYAAYDALPPALKQRLEGRSAFYAYGGRKHRANAAMLDGKARNAEPARHPLFQTHPETGRKVLFFDLVKVLRIEGYDAEESEALIEELTGYMIQPDGTYTHKWLMGDVVIWDNRCSYHKAAGDYPPEEDRIHWRVSIK